MTTNDAAPSPALTIAPEAARQLVPFTDLVGRQEIAEQLSVTVTAVDTWRRRYDTFPAPLAIISGTPIWRRSAILAWSHATPRRAGRPRKSEAPDG